MHNPSKMLSHLESSSSCMVSRKDHLGWQEVTEHLSGQVDQHSNTESLVC